VNDNKRDCCSYKHCFHEHFNSIAGFYWNWHTLCCAVSIGKHVYREIYWQNGKWPCSNYDISFIDDRDRKKCVKVYIIAVFLRLFIYFSTFLYFTSGHLCPVMIAVSTSSSDSWFQTFSVFWMLYAFFWVFPPRLNCVCRRFGTLSVPSSQADRCTPMRLWRWNRQGSETSAHTIQTRGK
jgi:hypothetical protein